MVLNISHEDKRKYKESLRPKKARIRKNRLATMSDEFGLLTSAFPQNIPGLVRSALQEAGLHVDNEDLNFNLRGEENHAKEGDNSSGRAANVEDDVVLLDNEIIEQAVISSDGRVLSKGRIDVRA